MERRDADPALKPALMQFDMALAEFMHSQESAGIFGTLRRNTQVTIAAVRASSSQIYR